MLFVVPEPWKIEKRDHPWGEAGIRSSLDEVAKKAAEGASHPNVRTFSIEMLDEARKRGEQVHRPRDRARVLLAAAQKKLWVPDPVGTEYIPAAHLLACDPDKPKDGQVCVRGDDCFPQGTLLLTDWYTLAPIEALKVGDKVWGLDRFSTVENVVYKGSLAVDVVELNNGSQLRLTKGHHVFVLDCVDHPMLDAECRALPPDRNWREPDGQRCACGDRVEKKVLVSELREGMVLVQPKRIDFGTGRHPDAPRDHRRAYVEGLFVSDGWADYSKNARFYISGQDGCPKEKQKREVESICGDLGLNTGWKRKSIVVYGKEWTLRMQQMGRYAPEKHLLSLDLDEACAAQTLRGVMADSGSSGGASRESGARTLTTTSWLLAVQARVLHRMFGVDCSWRFVENHGGLGKNPIWRVSTRVQNPKDGRRSKLLRVKSVLQGVYEVPCWDITTDDHRVYLPEHDVTVSNCDGKAVLLAAMLSSVGIHTLIVGHAYNKLKQIEHVLCAAHLDKKWLYAEPSADFPLGKCVPFSRERVLSIPNIQVLCDDTVCIGRKQFDPEKVEFVDKGVFVGVGDLSGLDGLSAELVWVTEASEPSLLEVAARRF